VTNMFLHCCMCTSYGGTQQSYQEAGSMLYKEGTVPMQTR